MKEPTKPNLCESALRVTDTSAARPTDSERGTGRLLTDSGLASTAIITEYTRKSNETADIFHALEMQAISIHAGDQTQVEAMLINQAVALQTMFMDLAVRAKNQTSMDGVQCLTRLALKAQSGCRATLQTLADIRSPRQVAFFKQTNVAQNQLVNNVKAQHSREEKIEYQPNELLVEARNGSKEMVARTEETASRSDQKLEAVGPIHRAKKRLG